MVFVKEVTEHLGITEQEFGMTHQQLAQNPQTAMAVMAAQQGKLSAPSTEKPTIPVETVEKAFEFQMKQAQEQMKKMQTQGMQNPTSEKDQMAMAMQLMVEDAKKQDQLFFELGVEQEEIELATQYYMENNNEFKMKMQK